MLAVRGRSQKIFQAGTMKQAVTARQVLQEHSAKEMWSVYRQGANGIKEYAALFTDFADTVGFCSSVLPCVMHGSQGLTLSGASRGEPAGTAASSSAATGWSDLPKTAKLGWYISHCKFKTEI